MIALNLSSFVDNDINILCLHALTNRRKNYSLNQIIVQTLNEFTLKYTGLHIQINED